MPLSTVGLIVLASIIATWHLVGGLAFTAAAIMSHLRPGGDSSKAGTLRQHVHSALWYLATAAVLFRLVFVVGTLS